MAVLVSLSPTWASKLGRSSIVREADTTYKVSTQSDMERASRTFHKELHAAHAFETLKRAEKR